MLEVCCWCCGVVVFEFVNVIRIWILWWLWLRLRLCDFLNVIVVVSGIVSLDCVSGCCSRREWEAKLFACFSICYLKIKWNIKIRFCCVCIGCFFWCCSCCCVGEFESLSMLLLSMLMSMIVFCDCDCVCMVCWWCCCCSGCERIGGGHFE